MFGESDEEEEGQGAPEGKKPNRMHDPIAVKLKGQDLRSAMLEWSSSSSEEEEEEEQGGETLPDLDDLKLPVSDYVSTGNETKRLAIVDMDWSRLKAVDLFGVLESFTPSNGTLRCQHPPPNPSSSSHTQHPTPHTQHPVPYTLSLNPNLERGGSGL